MPKRNVGNSVLAIGECIKSAKTSFYARRKRYQRIDFHQLKIVVYLTSGTVSLYQNDLLVEHITAPSIVGLHDFYEDGAAGEEFIRCTSDCEIWMISHNDLHNECDNHGLWFFVCSLLSHQLDRYAKKNSLASQRNVKKIIQEYICELWRSDASDSSIYTYILSRTLISRSSIHKTVSELMHDGVIEVLRGKLINLNEDKVTSLYN